MNFLPLRLITVFFEILKDNAYGPGKAYCILHCLYSCAFQRRIVQVLLQYQERIHSTENLKENMRHRAWFAWLRRRGLLLVLSQRALTTEGATLMQGEDQYLIKIASMVALTLGRLAAVVFLYVVLWVVHPVPYILHLCIMKIGCSVDHTTVHQGLLFPFLVYATRLPSSITMHTALGDTATTASHRHLEWSAVTQSKLPILV